MTKNVQPKTYSWFLHTYMIIDTPFLARYQLGSDTRNGYIPKGNVLNKLNSYQLARKHFIDTLVKNDGFSSSVRNENPMCADYVNKPVNKISRKVALDYQNSHRYQLNHY